MYFFLIRKVISISLVLKNRPPSSSTPSSSSGNMVCLPEEPELVKFGEDHKGLSPINYSNLSGTGNFANLEKPQKPVGLNNDNGAKMKIRSDKSLSDMSAQLSSSPSPPTITASSASSQVSSIGNYAMKNKPPTGN